MAIISFWSESKKQSGQTLSMVALATQMSIEHNAKILIVDATFNDKTLKNCFFRTTQQRVKMVSQFATAKIDVSSGAEGLISAIASNKITPEIIRNYTKVVNRNLDVLYGLKTKIPEEHETALMLYKDLVLTANKFYDYVFVDLNKGYEKPTTRALLECSSIVMYTMPQNLQLIHNFIDQKEQIPLLKQPNIMPMIGSCNTYSSYNEKNTARLLGEKRGIAYVPYNSYFMESACEGTVADYFIKVKFTKNASNKNDIFLKGISESDTRIIDRLKELNLRT